MAHLTPDFTGSSGNPWSTEPIEDGPRPGLIPNTHVEGYGEGSLLGYNAVLEEFKERRIIIHPFKQTNLSSASYDVTLGEHYYEEQPPKTWTTPKDHVGEIFNPYSEAAVNKIWGSPLTALTYTNLVKLGLLPENLENFGPDDQVILLGPGKTILAHTNEFIGGRFNITSMMKARSSHGRCFIEVCKCAGWGDVGYYNRFTMEITNNSTHYHIPLKVGRRIAQIVFFRVEGYGKEGVLSPTTKYTSQTHGSKYQTSDVLPIHFDAYDDKIVSLLESMWTPSQMLPKLFREKS